MTFLYQILVWSCEMKNTNHPNPYLSIVVTSRNDNHGENMMHRFEHFFQGLLFQAQKFGLSCELIVVEWNPPDDKPPLHRILSIPSDRRGCDVRFIEVPKKLHRSFSCKSNIPLFQMIAKNVGIRRARGQFVLSTCNDLIFSDELIWFLSRQILKEHQFYRCDRHDLSICLIPESLSWEEKMKFCRENVTSVCSCVDRQGVSAQVEAKIAANWFSLSDKQLLEQLKRGRELPIHTNACGDFTLMSSTAWHALQGYPEIAIGDMFIDGFGVYMATAMGMQQVVLPNPMALFHVFHSMNAAGGLSLQQRLKRRPSLDYRDEYLTWCQHMIEEGRPQNSNSEGWGLSDFDLPETLFHATTTHQRR